MAGTKITQLEGSGTPTRRYGDFTGRSPAAGRTVGILTQLQCAAIPGRRYGAFTGRTSGGGGTTGAGSIFGGAILTGSPNGGWL